MLARATVTGQRGAGSVLAVAVLAGIVLLTAIALPAVGMFRALRQVQAAADAAALAAADTLSGRVAGYPCDNASRLAALDGADVSSCRTDALIATVAVSARYLGVPLTASARAGPPGSR